MVDQSLNARSEVGRVRSYLTELVFVRKQYGQDRTSSQQVFHLEGIQTRVLRRLVIGKHQIYGVCRGTQKEEFESGVPCRVGEGPEDIYRHF